MILITGGAGLTGTFVAKELIRRGEAVRVLARPGSAPMARTQGAEVAESDLADSDSLRRAAQGVTGIVHAACTFTDSHIDLAAMETLLDSWRTGPFLYISSLDVYGYARATPFTEDDPLDGSLSEYAQGKVTCERLLTERARAYARTDYGMLRAPYIWGPHLKARNRLVKARLHQGLPIVLPGATEAERSSYQDVWIDVRDLAWIVAEALRRPPGGPLNVLSGHITWHEVYEQLIRLTGSASRIEHRPLDEISDAELPRKQIYAQTWRFSDQRLRQHLGFVPRFSLAETLAATVAAG